MYDMFIQNIHWFIIAASVLVVVVAMWTGRRWSRFVNKSFTAPVKAGVNTRLDQWQSEIDRRYDLLLESEKAAADERRARLTGGLFAAGSAVVTFTLACLNPLVGFIVGARLLGKTIDVTRESHEAIEAAKSRRAKAVGSQDLLDS